MAFPVSFCDEGEGVVDAWSPGPGTGDYFVERLDDAFGEHDIHVHAYLTTLSKSPVPEATITLVWSAEERVVDLEEVVTSAVQAAIGASRLDFRTVASLASELQLSPSVVKQALAVLTKAGTVRRPLTIEPQFDDWYRLTARGSTWQEKARRLRAMAGRDRY